MRQALLEHADLCRLIRQPLLQRRDVLKQPGAGETKEVKAELRILHVQFLDLAVAYAQDEAGLHALQRLGSDIRGRQHPELADDGAHRQFDADSTSLNRPLTM